MEESGRWLSGWRDASLPDSEHHRHRGRRLLLCVEVNVRIDVHRDLGAVMARELLHDLRVHAVERE